MSSYFNVQENGIEAMNQIHPTATLPLMDELENSKLWFRLQWESEYWKMITFCPEVQVGLTHDCGQTKWINIRYE